MAAEAALYTALQVLGHRDAELVVGVAAIAATSKTVARLARNFVRAATEPGAAGFINNTSCVTLMESPYQGFYVRVGENYVSFEVGCDSSSILEVDSPEIQGIVRCALKIGDWWGSITGTKVEHELSQYICDAPGPIGQLLNHMCGLRGIEYVEVDAAR